MHSTDMRRHRRSHGLEEKRFACEFCDRRFYERKFLTVHMRAHKLVTSTINIEMEVLVDNGEHNTEREEIDAAEAYIKEEELFVEEQ